MKHNLILSALKCVCLRIVYSYEFSFYCVIYSLYMNAINKHAPHDAMHMSCDYTIIQQQKQQNTL